MMRRSLVLGALAIALCVRPAVAQDREVEEAKTYFKAGAAAYAAGDYLAAIQALDSAYKLTPLPAIAFSLAQAERRQYFVSREHAHLQRALTLFREYLAQVATGGRRADAADALSQLEPLALGQSDEEGGVESSARNESAKTRLLVSSGAAGAKVSLDGGPASPSPLIAELKPGEHVVRVEASGYFPAERRVVAVAGALLPIEVALERRPARLLVHAVPTVDVYVDGQFVGKAGKATSIDLASGRHTLSFARKGYRVLTTEVTLAPGEAKPVGAGLTPTSQRTASLVLMTGSIAAAVVGLTVGAAALGQEQDAMRIEARRKLGNITPKEREEYEDSLERRNQFRVVSIGALIASGASLITGVCMHELDQPNMRDAFSSQRGSSGTGTRLSLVPASEGTGLAALVVF